MQINLLYFGVLKDLFGSESDVKTLPDGATVAALLEQVQALGDRDSPVWRSLAVAVNREYAGRGTVLHEGDEVALLPPVSGGAA